MTAPMVDVKYYCCFDEPIPEPQPPCEVVYDSCCCPKKESTKYENHNYNLFFIKNKFVNGYGYYLSTQIAGADDCNPNGFIYPLNGTKASYIKRFELIPKTCIYPGPGKCPVKCSNNYYN
jgi:hypothetical protein